MNKALIGFGIAAIGVIAIFIIHSQAPKKTAMTMQQKMAMIPSDKDYSRTRLSEDKKFRISVSSLIEPIPINQIHQWVIYIETSVGVPVVDAKVSISGGMPMHKHGLPTAPRVTKNLGEAKYLLEGVKFNMTGWWELIIKVNTPSDQDITIFNVILR